MISSLVVTLVFAVIGWLLFRDVKAPKKWWAWVLVILATIFAGTVGISIIVFGFPGFEMHLNDILQGLAIGGVARLILKTVKIHKLNVKET